MSDYKIMVKRYNETVEKLRSSNAMLKTRNRTIDTQNEIIKDLQRENYALKNEINQWKLLLKESMDYAKNEEEDYVQLFTGIADLKKEMSIVLENNIK